ncbi:YdeI/OmpD-associated family protein [Flavihumibacter sp. CACIAM 22H1]|uniref:YdeI/OmpD-associated family protein n=1 Tax=Flavihumibacter sp. CACIAM 22H1 TaxID=1812911 RepID=UPI0007A84922|nr:YdeI/OmpD-associated family protein [Flavihumibacter sp. CACIAM 22H1]KYP15761.1 MAG: hypothetical protein A1D16_05325 [Flavihumibacter sp. CACIAM 22H1]
MPQTDQRIDAYIAKAAPFAQPILLHLREQIHRACPGVVETIKWGFPHFEYKSSLLCSFAAFKQHCAFSFWKASLLQDQLQQHHATAEKSMGQLGRIRSLTDLPAEFSHLLQEAMLLNEQGIKPPRKKATEQKQSLLPAAFEQALRKQHRAWEIFDKFSYSNRKDYIEWITDAKTTNTRSKRISQAVEWIAEGKTRNWKYSG